MPIDDEDDTFAADLERIADREVQLQNLKHALQVLARALARMPEGESYGEEYPYRSPTHSSQAPHWLLGSLLATQRTHS